MRLYLILLFQLSTAFGNAQLYIAYNPSDCAMCNVMFGEFFKPENATPLTVVYPSYVEHIDDNALREMWMVSQFESNANAEVLYNDSLYDALSENGRSSMSFVSESDRFTVGVSGISAIRFPESDSKHIEISLKEQPYNPSMGRPISLGFREGKEVLLDRPTNRIFWGDIDKPIFTFLSLQDSLLVTYYRNIGMSQNQIEKTLAVNKQLPFSVISVGTFLLKGNTVFA